MFNLINRSNPKTLSQYNSIELLPAKRRRRRRRGGSLSWTFIWRGKNGKSCCFIFHPDYIPPSHRSILNNRDQFSYHIRPISSSSSFFFFLLSQNETERNPRISPSFLYFRISFRFVSNINAIIVIILYFFSTNYITLLVETNTRLSTQQFRGNLSANTSATRQDVCTILVNTWWIIRRECLNALLRRTIVLAILIEAILQYYIILYISRRWISSFINSREYYQYS